jgi:hypothetical protein
MKAIYTPSLFTPSEAEVITGVSVTLQRDWRHRGFLEKGEGHARFDVFALARLAFMKALADRGIGPSETHEVATIAAAGIVSRMASWFDFWEGDADLALTWSGVTLPECETDEAKAKSILKALGMLGRQDLLDHLLKKTGSLPSNWNIKSRWLVSQLLAERGFPMTTDQYFIWWPNRSATFEASVDDALKKFVSRNGEVSGAIVLLDLTGLGSALGDRTVRSFVHVELPKSEAGALVAPLEYGAPLPFTPTPQ